MLTIGPAELGAVQPVSHPDPSPCMLACPAGVNVKAYVSLIAAGRLAESLAVVRERCPFPGVCGRVCTRPCEDACNRVASGGAVGIRDLKRVVADAELALADAAVLPEAVPLRFDAKVAVVGGGPAGLTAAVDLRRLGVPVTVFEAEDEAGGMLVYGIPDYRLPPEIVRHEVDVIRREGVEIRTGVRVGPDVSLEALRDEGYAVVYLAVGAARGRAMGVPDEEDCAAVVDCIDFLARVNRGEPRDLGARVVVVGGGNSALDAARVAVRLGAHVTIAYRRREEDMPALREEIEQAGQEGVELICHAGPARVVVEGGRLQGLQCVRTRPGEPDSSGRPRPVVVPDSEFLIEADTIILAVGASPDLAFLGEAEREAISQWGRLSVGADGASTAKDGVYAGGDAVTGPATVVEAMGAGHAAAEAIYRTLVGEETAVRAFAAPGGAGEWSYPVPSPEPEPRREPGLLPVARRLGTFTEVEHALGTEDAVAEADRCLRCGPCVECAACVSECGWRNAFAGRVQGAPGQVVRVPRTAWNGAAASLGDLVVRLDWSGEGESAALDARLSPFLCRVRPELCRTCDRCTEACAYDAVVFDGPDSPARIDSARCRGCTLCTVACPTGAITTIAEPVLAGALGDLEGREVWLTCAPGPLAATGLGTGDDRHVVPVPCVGGVDCGTILRATGAGASRVVLAPCGDGGCRYGQGRVRARREVDRTRALLGLLGLPADRVALQGGAGEGPS